MPLRSDWSAATCPIARSLDVVGDPWMLLILRHALLGVRRYEDFRTGLGVADNVLSRRLPAMVDAGLLRKAVPGRAAQPLRVRVDRGRRRPPTRAQCAVVVGRKAHQCTRGERRNEYLASALRCPQQLG